MSVDNAVYVRHEQCSRREGAPALAELYMHLDPLWPLERVAVDYSSNRWPIDLLSQFARIPHQTRAWESHPIEIFESESEADTLVPGCPYSGGFAFREREMRRVSDNETIGLYRFVPL